MEGKFAPWCIDSLRRIINDYGGCEVFALGTCDASGLVEQLDPIAFGNWTSVPAPAQDARPGQVLIHNHPSGDLEPSDADVSVASNYGKAGIGFYIVDNACEQVRIVVKPFRETKQVPVNTEELAGIFGPKGKLASGMPGYEFRPQQVEMLTLAARAFNENRIAVVEAGTGTGKSFAYMAPAITWSQKNKTRVVVSTNTINLQEQLLNKDLPELSEKLGWKFKAVLVKGRSNYVCLRRLRFAAAQGDMIEGGKHGQLRQLQEWTGKTADGSRSDLAFAVSDEAWEEACSDKDDCLRAACPHFNDCFFYKSRREAASADIIIANHHLVMVDLAITKDSAGNDFAAILPIFERVVFDEAHHLEEVATSYFSCETSALAIRRLLSRLNPGSNRRGLLTMLHEAVNRLDAGQLYPPTTQLVRLLGGELHYEIQQLELKLSDLFEELFHKTTAFFNVRLAPRERKELRITAQVKENEYWNQITGVLEQMLEALNSFLKLLQKTVNLFKFYPEEIARELVDLRLGLGSCESKLAEHTGSLTSFLTSSDDDNCRWFEVGTFRDKPFIRPCTAPLDMAPLLRQALFAKKKTVLLTSATLTVEGEFDFISRQLGLGAVGAAADAALAPVLPDSGVPVKAPDPTLADVPARCDFLKLGTPFDYAQNCMVGVPLDMVSPTSPQFDTASQQIILDTIRISQGRAFVLFTSYRSLETVFRSVHQQLAQEGIVALRQGEMPRHRLLELFRTSSRAALFATSSFWEGVDVQGKALETLILARLPFRVPTTPILEARTERIDRNGGDSFRELTIPLAVIKFKQGFGRLIRSKNDRGIVMILDQRAGTKNYGKIFLRSLPPVTIVLDTTDNVLRKLRGFYSGKPV